jgi:hypothetical protein
MFNSFKLSEMGDETPSRKIRKDPRAALTRWGKNNHSDKFDMASTGKKSRAPTDDQIKNELNNIKPHLGEEVVESLASDYAYLRTNAPNTSIRLKEGYIQFDLEHGFSNDESDQSDGDTDKNIDDIVSRFEKINLGQSDDGHTSNNTFKLVDDAIKVIDDVIDECLFTRRALANTLHFLQSKVEMDVVENLNDIFRVEYVSTGEDASNKEYYKKLIGKSERRSRNKFGGYMRIIESTAEDLKEQEYVESLIVKEMERRKHKMRDSDCHI